MLQRSCYPIPLALVLVAVAAGLLVPSVRGEEWKLNNGRTIEGEVAEEHERVLVIREPSGRRITVARTQLIESADPALDVKDADGNVLLKASDWDPKVWPLVQRMRDNRNRLLGMYRAGVISGDVYQEEIKLQTEVCTTRIRALHPDLSPKSLLAWRAPPARPLQNTPLDRAGSGGFDLFH